ncbi:ABC transporter ATP-binding protein [Cellulomonas wangsupingiae]|uniref:ABC transporter ATP-binding protein/permease n=1 Tax=Cellulomonas wangsupingiae TaxID=2968085 RepID=A0ABY5K450_9CELL|nr:ABC transporter ATP-binding protein [Cellulomonas wangsupingiae]MCC2333978.1 ABC transporter ATP-binding protein/permease [Cellulomonas wangsupingiae]UUI65232.1 ABC transporter ATP-binding protein/permease [Cellulomonas wangsupingiae]
MTTTETSPPPAATGRRHVDRLVRAHRGRFAWSYAFQVVGGVAPLLQVLLLRSVVDGLVEERTVGTQVAWQVAGMFALGLVGVWAAYAAKVVSTGAAGAVIADMQSSMFRRLTTMPIHFYTTVRPGAVVSRLTSDAHGAEAMYTSVYPVVVSGVTTIVASVAIVAVIDPRLVVLLVVIPVAIAYVRKAEARINELIGKSFDVTKELASTAETFVSRDGAVLARQHGRTRHEQAHFEEHARELAVLSAATAKAAATSGASYGTAFVAITAGALGMGVWLVAEQNVTVGSVILIVLYLQQLQAPVQSLLNTRYPRMRSSIALDRVEAVLAAGPTGDEDAAPSTRPGTATAAEPSPAGPGRDDPAPALLMRGVRYRYPAVASYSIDGLSHAGDALSIAWLPLTGLDGNIRPVAVARDESEHANALDGIDLAIGRGEVVAVVGSSGAGKSTLAGIAAGLVDCDEGVVEVAGRTLRDLDEDRRAQLVAYIPQEPYVLHASVRDNLRYANPDATDAELLDVLRAVALDDLVRQLDDGLDSVIGEKGHRLSGGERQRLAIARAALKRPALVVLDEPTAHLDTSTEARVRAAMGELFGDAGVLMIAHRLSTVRHADRIVVLEGGRVVQAGRHEVLAQEPGRYRVLLESSSQDALS